MSASYITAARQGSTSSGSWTQGGATALAWLWLFLPTLWMWPSTRTAGDALLSALLWCGCLLWRPLMRLAACVLLPVGASYLGYFFAVRSAPDEFFWHSVLGASTSEAWEYFESYRVLDGLIALSWLLPAVLAVVYLWRVGRTLRGRWMRALGWISLLLWVALAMTGTAKSYGVEGTLRRVERVYPMTLAESYHRYAATSQAVYQIPEVAAPAQPPLVDVLVVVIGESASAQRWSLLGYADHDTNAPLARWRSGLVALPVTSNGNNTGKTVPVLLTGKRTTDIPAGGMETFLDAAHAAGFRVETLSNQSASGMELSFANAALRQRSDRFVNLPNGALDGDLSSLLAQSLQGRNAAAHGPLVVTLHMYGSHPRVNKRYPAAFAQWDDPYDNSLVYSSQLLADWIGQLDALKGQRTALVYVSDHGQNFPQCGGSYTHGSVRSAYEVPFLLWGSANLRSQQAAWWAQWQQMERHAVAADSSLRYTNGLFTATVNHLLGYPRDVQTAGAAEHVASQGDGVYPPPTERNGCEDWSAQVARQHPLALP